MYIIKIAVNHYSVPDIFISDYRNIKHIFYMYSQHFNSFNAQCFRNIKLKYCYNNSNGKCRKVNYKLRIINLVEVSILCKLFLACPTTTRI